MRRASLLAGVAALVAAAPAPASAAGITHWRVTEATHTSSATFRSDDAAGSSLMRWSLARPTSTAPNRIVVGVPGGGGQVNIAGTVESRAQDRTGACALSGRTGDGRYGFETPEAFSVNVTFRGSVAEAALSARWTRLGSTYFSCSLRGTRPPSPKQVNVTTFPRSALRGRRIVLAFRGTHAGAVDRYAWRTRLVLTRARAPR